ncbi:hypothetical protein CM49_06575 [Paenibacillus sp. P1XP2]|nr:hypothetical protein CM49_06575 [Paenibacillus sp. P1XP2]
MPQRRSEPLTSGSDHRLLPAPKPVSGLPPGEGERGQGEQGSLAAGGRKGVQRAKALCVPPQGAEGVAFLLRKEKKAIKLGLIA